MMDCGLKSWLDFYIRASLNALAVYYRNLLHWRKRLVWKSLSLNESFSMKIFWFIFLTLYQGKQTTLTAVNGFPLRCWDAQTIELFACAAVWILSFLIVYRLCYSQSSRIFFSIHTQVLLVVFYQNCHTVKSLFINDLVLTSSVTKCSAIDIDIHPN